ncbi:MAG: M48 family metalloprotease [bacterium]|nr:M48 family metalloprotease [bacterium]
MKNRFLVCGIVIGVLSCSNAIANPAQYGVSQLQLNNQIMDMMNSPTPSNNTSYQNQVKPAKQEVKKATDNKSMNYYTPPAQAAPSYQMKPAFQEKLNTTNSKNISEKDLQIEGRIEKTQKESLYQNQSPAELQAMVNRIGKNIIRANGITTPITFKYDESDVANANTNFSGTIRVYKGLIKYCEDEAELAYVIGHEIGHATSHHVAKGIAVRATGAVATSAATIAVEEATKNKWASMGVGLAAEALTGLGEKKVSRVMEKNADLLSMDYVVKAGYNPLAAIAIMNKIGENYVDFWADHPSTDKRIVMMYDYVKKNYPGYLAGGYDSTFYDQAMEDYIYNEAYYRKLSENYR